MDLMEMKTIAKKFVGMVKLSIKKEIIRESANEYKKIRNIVPSDNDKENSLAFFAADFDMNDRNNILIN